MEGVEDELDELDESGFPVSSSSEKCNSSINVFGSVDVSYSDWSYILFSPSRSDFLVDEQSFCSAINESVQGFSVFISFDFNRN